MSWESLNESTFPPSTATKIVGLAFLSMFGAWEEFLEDTYVRYLAGASAGSGYSPGRLVLPVSIRHARMVLGGGGGIHNPHQAMKWSDYTWVCKLSEIHFSRGAPFNDVPAWARERLADAQVLRNRVAHSSVRAKKQFKDVGLKLAKLPEESSLWPGATPGSLLVTRAHGDLFPVPATDCDSLIHDDMFAKYFEMFYWLAEVLSPSGR